MKIPESVTDSEYEDLFANTAISEVSIGGEDPMDQDATVCCSRTVRVKGPME